MPLGWGLAWGFLGRLPVATMGIGAAAGIPDVAERRRALALWLGLGAAGVGAVAGVLAAWCRARWHAVIIGIACGAIIGFNSTYWDLGQPDTLSNGMVGAAVYAAVGLGLGLATGRSMVQT